MTPTAVILYGPPASGKDTITEALIRLDSRYVRYRRMKVGSGKTDGYRVGTVDQISQLRVAGHVLYENNRYGNTYVVDRPHLTSLLAAGHTPIVHLGQVAGIEALTHYPARWVTVLLWCSRETTALRAHARGSADVESRLTAWDDTLADLHGADGALFSGRIDTDTIDPEGAADTIDAWVQRAMSSVDGPRR
jgi:guanylate kinase